MSSVVASKKSSEKPVIEVLKKDPLAPKTNFVTLTFMHSISSKAINIFEQPKSFKNAVLCVSLNNEKLYGVILTLRS
jgi:hypothetical protein